MTLNLQFEPEQIRYTADVSFGTLSDIEQELRKAKVERSLKAKVTPLQNTAVTFAREVKATTPQAKGIENKTTEFLVPKLQLRRKI